MPLKLNGKCRLQNRLITVDDLLLMISLKVAETSVTQLIPPLLINNNNYSTYFSKSTSLSNDGCRKLGEHEGHFSSALWSRFFQKALITQ